MSAISETHESLMDQFNFIEGLNIMKRYALEHFDICVIEIAEIAVHGMKRLSDEDFEKLKKLGWNAHQMVDESSAEYGRLRYVET